MVGDNLEKIYRRCIRYSLSKHSNYQDAEDFAQFTIMKRLEGRKPRMMRAYVDFIRHIRGRKDKNNKSLKNKSGQHIDVYDCQIEDLNDKTGHEGIKNFLECLSGRKRKIAEWYIIGYSLTEIGRELNICPARVHQEIKVIVKIIQSAYLGYVFDETN